MTYRNDWRGTPMDIAYRAGVEDGTDYGYRQGWEACERVRARVEGYDARGAAFAVGAFAGAVVAVIVVLLSIFVLTA